MKTLIQPEMTVANTDRHWHCYLHHVKAVILDYQIAYSVVVIDSILIRLLLLSTSFRDAHVVREYTYILLHNKYDLGGSTFVFEFCGCATTATTTAIINT